MQKEIIIKLIKNFEELAYEKNKKKFWLAKELQLLLEYKEWQKFLIVIEKAKLACKTAGFNISKHFVDTYKAKLGSEKIIKDIILTRYACYLITQNISSKKEKIASLTNYPELNKIKLEFIKEIDYLLKLYFNYEAGISLYIDMIKPVKYPKFLKILFKNIDNPTPIYYFYEGIKKPLANETTEEVYQKFYKENKSELANFIISHIYNLWENIYRIRIAKVKKIDKNKITSDLFYELNTIRQGIIHKREFAIKRSIKNKITKRFKHNEKIFFKSNEFIELIIKIKKEIEYITQ